MVYRVSCVYSLISGRQTRYQAVTLIMSANTILILYYILDGTSNIFWCFGPFQEGGFFLPKLKHWDSKTDYSLETALSIVEELTNVKRKEDGFAGISFDV